MKGWELRTALLKGYQEELPGYPALAAKEKEDDLELERFMAPKRASRS